MDSKGDVMIDFSHIKKAIDNYRTKTKNPFSRIELQNHSICKGGNPQERKYAMLYHELLDVKELPNTLPNKEELVLYIETQISNLETGLILDDCNLPYVEGIENRDSFTEQWEEIENKLQLKKELYEQENITNMFDNSEFLTEHREELENIILTLKNGNGTERDMRVMILSLLEKVERHEQHEILDLLSQNRLLLYPSLCNDVFKVGANTVSNQRKNEILAEFESSCINRKEYYEVSENSAARFLLTTLGDYITEAPEFIDCEDEGKDFSIKFTFNSGCITIRAEVKHENYAYPSFEVGKGKGRLNTEFLCNKFSDKESVRLITEHGNKPFDLSTSELPDEVFNYIKNNDDALIKSKNTAKLKDNEYSSKQAFINQTASFLNTTSHYLFSFLEPSKDNKRNCELAFVPDILKEIHNGRWKLDNITHKTNSSSKRGEATLSAKYPGYYDNKITILRYDKDYQLTDT